MIHEIHRQANISIWVMGVLTEYIHGLEGILVFVFFLFLQWFMQSSSFYNLEVWGYECEPPAVKPEETHFQCFIILNPTASFNQQKLTKAYFLINHRNFFFSIFLPEMNKKPRNENYLNHI